MTLLMPYALPPPGSFDYYVSSFADGNDANSGTSSSQPFASLSRLQGVIQPGQIFALRAGSIFYDQLDASAVAAGAGAWTISAAVYGVGAQPIIDATDVAPNSNFNQTLGSTYQINWTNAFGVMFNNSVISVFEDGVRLIQATSLANCEATPGSYFTSGPSGNNSTDIVYVQATNSSSIPHNTSIYRITKRPYCLNQMLNTVGITAQRSGHNNGSIVSTNATNCNAKDGARHNFFSNGGTYNNCTSIGLLGLPSFGGGTHYVFFQTNGDSTLGMAYNNCNVVGNPSAAYFEGDNLGFFCHTGDAVRAKNMVINGGNISGIALATSGQNIIDFSVSNLVCHIVNNLASVTSDVSTMELKGNFLGPSLNSFGGTLISSTALNGQTWTIKGNVTTNGGCFSDNTVADTGTAVVTFNTFTAPNVSLAGQISSVVTAGGLSLTFENNIGVGTGEMLALWSGPLYAIDKNIYDNFGNFAWNGAFVTPPFSTWQADTGQDANSSFITRSAIKFVTDPSTWQKVSDAVVQASSPAVSIQAGAQFWNGL